MIEPDEVKTRGSRRAEPPIPVHHVWQVICDDRGMTVDEQVRKVVDRVRPRQAAIAELTREPDARCGAVLEVVRYFDDGNGEEEEISPPMHSSRRFQASISSVAGTSTETSSHS